MMSSTQTNTVFQTNDYPYLYPPDSLIWQVYRERALLLAAPKILLMQIAHPMIAESVYHHSYVFRNPVKRLHRTLALTLGIIFGTQDEIAAAVKEIEAAHRPAVGTLEHGAGKHKAGDAYNPRNPRQALWVFATLVEGAITAYDQFVAPLTPEQREEIYHDSLEFARIMHIREAILPQSYAELLDYMDSVINSDEIAVSDKAREVARFITFQSVPVMNVVAYPMFRMSALLLPPSIRQQFGYETHAWEQSILNRFASMTKRVVPYVPHLLRFPPEYLKACRQLES